MKDKQYARFDPAQLCSGQLRASGETGDVGAAGSGRSQDQAKSTQVDVRLIIHLLKRWRH
jgi:hypothetical protein